MEHWNQCLKPYLDKGTTWGDLPWYVGETYVYHRLLESSGYWDKGSRGFGLDIFAREKAEALELAFPQVEARAAIAGEAKGKWDAQSCRAMLLMSLWGNQGDSSLFTIQDMAAMGGEAKSDERIILDDVDDAWNNLCRVVSSGKGLDVHFLNDNAGLELASDLFLSHYLLSTGKVCFLGVDSGLGAENSMIPQTQTTTNAHTLPASPLCVRTYRFISCHGRVSHGIRHAHNH